MTYRELEEQLRGWFAGRLPQDWFESAPRVTVDREEVLVVGVLSAPALGVEASPVERQAASAGRAKRFREETRDRRMEVAREAEHRFGRKVAWGVECGEDAYVFTNLSVPVMTRLRQPERRVLDTLVDAGVARSRADALAWCVRLVGAHTEDWLAELRSAMEQVERVRARGPEKGPQAEE